MFIPLVKAFPLIFRPGAVYCHLLCTYFKAFTVAMVLTIKDRDFMIFEMHTLLIKPFQMTPMSMTCDHYTKGSRIDYVVTGGNL